MSWADLMICKCIPKWTVEEHGNGYTIYHGRCRHKHGYNWSHLTECSPQMAEKIENALNSYDPENQKT